MQYIGKISYYLVDKINTSMIHVSTYIVESQNHLVEWNNADTNISRLYHSI